ncbi:MAG TPA: helix-turn-helix transcriptional regulator [Steroidobacteraceae bacterium]|jgi:putative transcriptional regulator
MPIIVNLDVMLARRKMRLNELSDRVGITPQNLSVLKTGRAKAIRFATLEKLCEVLDCQPGDLFAFENSNSNPSANDTPLRAPRKMSRTGT